MSDDLRARLLDVEVPGAADARERAFASVAAEFAARPGSAAPSAAPRPRPRFRVAPGIAVAVVLGVLMLAVAASATEPGAAVRGFVVRVLGGDTPPAPRARIGPLPPGRMLVTLPRGAWVVADDGTRTLLGAYTGAAVVAARPVRRGVERPRRARGRPRRPRGVDAADAGPGRERGVVAGRLPRRLPARGRPRPRRRRRHRAPPARRVGRPGRAGVAARRAAHARMGRPERAASSCRTSTPAASCGARPAGSARRGRCRGRPTARCCSSRRPTACALADVRTRTVERVRAAERRPCGRCGVGAAGRRLAVVARGSSSDLTRVLVAPGGTGSPTGPCSRRRGAWPRPPVARRLARARALGRRGRVAAAVAGAGGFGARSGGLRLRDRRGGRAGGSGDRGDLAGRAAVRRDAGRAGVVLRVGAAPRAPGRLGCSANAGRPTRTERRTDARLGRIPDARRPKIAPHRHPPAWGENQTRGDRNPPHATRRSKTSRHRARIGAALMPRVTPRSPASSYDRRRTDKPSRSVRNPAHDRRTPPSPRWRPTSTAS